MRYHKLRPGAVTILYDELDLAPGKVRVKMAAVMQDITGYEASHRT